ncbi:hypothetical protein CALCODRAFT_504746 [Calocera cornea HHB12733]|uniref:VWFA domain-containing protein n=1 Tax=Calocera cornea HHB12733 TaxID=1353952 RepID=A0A165C934_9BASI|nr:hypothetical protein CALCODRAFT_504746 [Calocera cornea HHB12733]
MSPPAAAPPRIITSQAERPLSQISTSSGVPPPPYSPVDERLIQQFAAMNMPGGEDAVEEPEVFSTPQSTSIDLPSQTFDRTEAAVNRTPSSARSGSNPRPPSQRRHGSGGSTGSTHRRTQSSSSQSHPQSRHRDLPPTPGTDDESDLPPTVRPHAIYRPATPPASAGSRHTSFRVRSPTQEPHAPELARQTSHGSTTSRGSHRRRGSGQAEDPLVLLRKYDTIILVDDSVSMADLWYEAKSALAEIATMAAKYDIDGVDIYFVNDRKQGIGLKTADAVIALFDSIEPAGQDSEIAGRLEEFLLPYLSRIEKYQQAVELGTAAHLQLQKVRPINFIILTDGVPSDDPESVIVSAARRLDAQNFPLSQVGIQFVQLGDDPEATEVLQHLDDGLGKAYGIRDIVDWTLLPEGRLDAGVLTKILLGGINRRVDGKAGH